MPLTTELVIFILSIVGVSTGVIKSVNGSISGLRDQIDERTDRIELQIAKLEKDTQLFSERTSNDVDRLDLATNGVRELIEHRTRRFQEADRYNAGRMSQLESRLRDTELFLVKTSEFQVRSRTDAQDS
jgi:hypothetical protein